MTLRREDDIAELNRLRDEVAKLAAESERWHASLLQAQEFMREWKKRADAAESRVAELSEQVEKLAGLLSAGVPPDDPPESFWERWRIEVRAALAALKETPK